MTFSQNVVVVHLCFITFFSDASVKSERVRGLRGSSSYQNRLLVPTGRNGSRLFFFPGHKMHNNSALTLFILLFSIHALCNILLVCSNMKRRGARISYRAKEAQPTDERESEREKECEKNKFCWPINYADSHHLGVEPRIVNCSFTTPFWR